MNQLGPDQPVFLLDSEFFYNRTGIGQDSKIILDAIREKWSTEEDASFDWLSKSGAWKRKIMQFCWIFKLGILRASGSKGAVFYQSQIGLLRPPKDAKDWIIRVHDLFPITNPEWFHFWDRYFFKFSLDNALKCGAGFIVNSQTTKEALCGYANHTIRTEVLPCAIRPLTGDLCNNCKGCAWLEVNHRFSYAIALGTLEPRKNYLELIASWEMRSDNRIELVIVGKVGWKSKKIVRALKGSRRITHINSCCDGALNALFKKSHSFISASFAEGFDLPAMEARQLYGLPLVLSDISVHREFHKDAAYFFKEVSELTDLDVHRIPNSETSKYLSEINVVDVFIKLMNT